MRKAGSKKDKVASLHAKALRALREAVTEMVKEKALTGSKVVIWRNGKVARIPAKQLRTAARAKRKS